MLCAEFLMFIGLVFIITRTAVLKKRKSNLLMNSLHLKLKNFLNKVMNDSVHVKSKHCSDVRV